MMSYMPAQVKTEMFKLTETHLILTFFKNDTENIPPPKNKAENKKLSVFKKIFGFFGAVLFILGLIVNLEYIPNFSAKTLPTWFNWGIIGVSVALLMIAFGTKSKRPIDLPRKSSKLSKKNRQYGNYGFACNSSYNFCWNDISSGSEISFYFTPGYD